MHVSLPLPEEETEAQRGYSHYQGITDEGFKPGVSDPRALLFPSYHAAIIFSCWDGEGQQGGSVLDKRIGNIPDLKCLSHILTAQVSLGLMLELKRRLPIQPGNRQRIQMGKHFYQKGN